MTRAESRDHEICSSELWTEASLGLVLDTFEGGANGNMDTCYV